MASDRSAPERFTPEFFRFLRELAKHNERNWFQANKGRFDESVQAPTRAFVEAMGPKLQKISRHLVADPRPVGGSIMRIYRDVRFSKDKSPYRTSIGIHFWHDGVTADEEHLPGFFLHLAPGDSWVYAGVWQAAPPHLAKIRTAIAERPGAWKKVRAQVPEIEGESLKRPPPGFDPDHPYIADLKRKGFTTGQTVADSVVTGPRFPEKFVAICRSLDPLNRFLAGAVGVPY
jgi:uncharacterized protein (TIGR02453 family)